MANISIKDIPFNKIITYNKEGMTVLANDGKYYYLTEGTLAWRHNNPGNLKYGEFAKDFGSIGMGWEGHAVFSTYDDGAQAQYQLLFSREGQYYNKTIEEAVSIYAPVSDPNPVAHNNPPEYAKYIADAANVSVNTKLIELSENRRNLLLKAMRQFEGYSPGVITEVKE